MSSMIGGGMNSSESYQPLVQEAASSSAVVNKKNFTTKPWVCGMCSKQNPENTKFCEVCHENAPPEDGDLTG